MELRSHEFLWKLFFLNFIKLTQTNLQYSIKQFKKYIIYKKYTIKQYGNWIIFLRKYRILIIKKTATFQTKVMVLTKHYVAKYGECKYYTNSSRKNKHSRYLNRTVPIFSTNNWIMHWTNYVYVSADYDDNNERSRACLVESYCIKIQDVVTFLTMFMKVWFL